VNADLDTLRVRLGAQTVKDDGILAGDLEAATAWVHDRVMGCVLNDPEVAEAILLIASRLYKRRQSPDGLAGWSADGVVAHIGSYDPDVRRLLSRKLDMLKAGIG
jgi:hypothetical protein